MSITSRINVFHAKSSMKFCLLQEYGLRIPVYVIQYTVDAYISVKVENPYFQAKKPISRDMRWFIKD